MSTETATTQRAVLYGWDGEPVDEVHAADRQDLAEAIGSAIHQMLEHDSDTSEIRVQILEADIACVNCGKQARHVGDWAEEDVRGSGGDWIQFRCPRCQTTTTEATR